MKGLKKLAFVAIAVTALCAVAGAAFAENRLEKILKAGKIVVVTEPYFAPNEFIDNTKTGQDRFRGCDIDLAKYIANYLGVELEIVGLDFSAVLAGIQQGKYDLAISALAYTPKRAKALELSEVYQPDSTGHGIMVRKENADKYKSFEDFDGKVISVHSGTLQEQLVEAQLPKVKKKVFDSVQNAVLAVDHGKVDGVAISVDNGEMFVASHPDLVVLPLRFKMEKNGTVMAAPKGEVELINKMNEIIAEVREKDLYNGWEATAKEEAMKLGIK